jgi:HAD superfamily hydrolase (TIGR01549 family)
LRLRELDLAGLIFDLDGTLADTLPLCFLAYRQSLRPYLGRTLTDEEIASYFGPSEEGILQRLVPEAWQACLDAYLDVYAREHTAYNQAFTGLSDVLESLARGGIRLGIVTGKGARSAALSLEAIGIRRYFDAVETGSAQGGVKPSAIRKISSAWAMPPSRVAYVGDQPSDIRDAREAAVVPLAAAWAKTANPRALRAEKPARLFRTVAEFADWIRTGAT